MIALGRRRVLDYRGKFVSFEFGENFGKSEVGEFE